MRRRTVQVHFEGEGEERRPASASRKLRMSGRRVLIELEAEAADSLFLLYRKRAVEVVVAGALNRTSLEALHARLGPEYAIIEVPLVENAE